MAAISRVDLSKCLAPLLLLTANEFSGRFGGAAQPAWLAALKIVDNCTPSLAATKMNGSEVAAHRPQHVGIDQHGHTLDLLQVKLAIIRRQPTDQDRSLESQPRIGTAMRAAGDLVATQPPQRSAVRPRPT